MTSTDVKRPVCGSEQKTVISDRWSVNSEQLTAIIYQLLAANRHAEDACDARFRKDLEFGKNKRRSKTEL